MAKTSIEVKLSSDQLKEIKEAIEKLNRDFTDCRNELCLKCGDYKQRHNGACEGCRWNT